MSTTLGSSSKPIQSIRNVSPREVGSRDNDKDRDLLHAGCICNYVSIDSTTIKSVRVYSIVRREIANNMYYKLTIRYRKSHNLTFTLCLFRLRSTFLPDRVDCICHHDYFL